MFCAGTRQACLVCWFVVNRPLTVLLAGNLAWRLLLAVTHVRRTGDSAEGLGSQSSLFCHTGALSRVAHNAVVSQKKERSRKYKYLRGLCPSSGAEGGSVLPTGVSGLGSQGMWERVVLVAWTVRSCRPLPQNLPRGPVRSMASIWGRRQGEGGQWPDTLRVRPSWPCSSLCSPG